MHDIFHIYIYKYKFPCGLDKIVAKIKSSFDFTFRFIIMN